MPTIRKIARFIEDGLVEAGIPVDSPYRKVAVAVVLDNPYAGRFSDDLSEILDFSVGLGDQMGALLVETMGGPIQGFGKSSIVGMNGEEEHGHAFLTTVMADRVRMAVGGGAAWISSTGKRGGPGTAIDVPLAHKDALDGALPLRHPHGQRPRRSRSRRSGRHHRRRQPGSPQLPPRWPPSRRHHR